MKKSVRLQALKRAQDSLHRHPVYCSSNKNVYLHWSFIVMNNTIQSCGVNRRGLPPVYLGYRERIDGNTPSIHAEFDAVRKIRSRLNAPFSCINIRLSKGGELRLSKPCICCYNWLKLLGCKLFVFTTDVGFSYLD